jgi:nitroreductase
MDLLPLIESRYSVRDYEDRAVARETLDRVLDAGRLAPSARNLQQWRFVVVTDAGLRARLREAANGQAFVAAAPVVIAGCALKPEYVMRCGQPAYAIDLAIALDHMSLEAWSLGLGSCWVGSFYPDKVRAILDIPETVAVVELMTLGYPAGGPRSPKSRLPLERIASYNRFEESLRR